MFDREDKLVNEALALPAANATAYTDSIDLGGPGILGKVEFELGHEAVPSLVDAKTITLKIQDSADNVTFADLAAEASLVTSGAGGVGAVANSRRVKLPSTTRRYIRGAGTVLAAGGDNTAKKFYLKGKF